MAPIRLRHPGGVSTLQIPTDRDDFTVGDFQQQIFSASNILPSNQVVKTGYPPKSLTLIPELPFSSLGVKAGEQIIVSENSHPPIPPLASNASHAPSSSLPHSVSSSVSPAVAEQKTKKSPDYVETQDGNVLVHRVVPDDNSCLFSSAALIFEQDITKAQEIRKVVVNGIKNDLNVYNEAILGMAPEQYIQTMLKPATWGGAIELAILAGHYGTEIASIDVETGRVDRFPPGENDGNGMRCIFIYSGIHYDAASVAPMVDAPNEWHQTLFPIEGDNDAIIVAAKKLADILREKKAYTNTSTFDLKCEQCGLGLKGEKEARAHAEQTGHTRFGEY